MQAQYLDLGRTYVHWKAGHPRAGAEAAEEADAASDVSSEEGVDAGSASGAQMSFASLLLSSGQFFYSCEGWYGVRVSPAWRAGGRSGVACEHDDCLLMLRRWARGGGQRGRGRVGLFRQ